jgi:undecaprenyl-diphosphatase
MIDFEKGYLVTGLWAWAYFLNIIIKNTVRKPRPDPSQHKIKVTGFSFASGHSLTSFVLYTSIVKIFAVPFPWAWILLALPFLLGLSRLYLKVHYPEDVIGGWFIAYAYLMFLGPWINEVHLWLLRATIAKL